MSIGELQNEKWHRKLICPTCLKECFLDGLREFAGLFFLALFEPDGGCFFLHVGVEVCRCLLFVCFMSVCYTKTCVELACMHACNGDLVFAAAGSCLFCGAILRRYC